MSDHSVARVHAAARALVRTQDRWDDALRVPELRDLIPEDVVVQTGTAVCGDTLARWVLPFLDSRSGECTSGEIPVDRTLGESWRWTEQYQPSPDGRPLAAYLADPARGSRGDKDEAVVLGIEPLGLYVAHEGKNRVRFLREQGCPSMGALVRSSSYPQPDRLALYSVRVDGLGETWAVLDGSLVTRLRLPKLTINLLSAYGVAPVAPWPADWPPAATVRQALVAVEQEPLSARSVSIEDVVHLCERQSEGDTEVTTPAVDLRSLRLNWSWWMRFLAIATIAGVAGLLFGGKIGHQVAVAALFAVLGASLPVIYPAWKAPRRLLNAWFEPSVRRISGKADGA